MFAFSGYDPGMTQDKKQAAKAARELLLADRLPVIEELAEAHAKLDTLRQRENEARDARAAGEREVRERYADAQAKGWTSHELSQLGYAAPRKRSGGSSPRQGGAEANGDRSTASAPPSPSARTATAPATPPAAASTTSAGASDE